MNRLWVQLSLAFAAVALVGVVAAGVLAARQVGSGFRLYVGHSLVQEPGLQAERPGLLPDLEAYYAAHGSWSGVAEFISAEHSPQMPGGRGPWRRGIPAVVLADDDGNVVYDSSGHLLPGAQLSKRELGGSLAIEVSDQRVGYLVAEPPPPDALSAPERAFLRQVNWALAQAGLLAAGLGLVLGIVIARSLASPLSRLAGAARQISRGQLEPRVPVEGSYEVADLARAFNDMAGALQKAERLRKNMVADIAHELRTPLTVVRGNLRAILDDVYPLERAEIATIYDETLLLGRLIDDLRELATAEAGQLKLDMEPVAVPALLEGSVAAFGELAREQGISLAINAAAELPPVLADPGRVRQVVRNLVANALQFTPYGGTVTVTAEVVPAAAGAVRIAVRDTGAGISAADLPHVFDRFWRLEGSRSREHGGSGLGLAIARQLVQAMGGTIDAASEVGRGSEFWFVLPIAAETEDPPAGP